MAYKIDKDLYVGDTGKQLKDIKTNADNIATNTTNIATNTTDIATLRTLISQKGIKLGIMTQPSNRSYSASAWSRPNIYYSNFDTTDTNYFERQDNYNMVLKKKGVYLAYISRESDILDAEQDSYILLNNNWYSRTCYKASLSYMVMFGTSQDNTVIRNDINTGKTSWTIRNATMMVVKLDGD